jgi:hypothetical protein
MRHTIWTVVLAAMFAAAALPAAAGGEGEERENVAAEREEQLEQLEFEAQKAQLEAEIDRRRGKDKGGVVLLWMLVVNILLTVWVCKDMRAQGIGRALWVPIVLLGGFLGAILYAIVRNADTRAKPAGRARA